jgi:hippurate hydrolase
MHLIDGIVALHSEMKSWRRDIHAHPETAFEEFRTADFVAGKLQEFGIDVHRGLAGTGVVGTLKAGQGNRAIGLRADMDALHITEANDFTHKSTIDGKMHACGHDGHTTMLLGAAKYLAKTRGFDGTVHFIFQPAEENEGGGRVMVEQGLFDRFPVDCVFGLHNMPGLPENQFAMRPGALMASYDIFEIQVEGRGSHAAMPQHGIDPVVVASHIVLALQTIVSRNTHPLESAVVSVTQIHGGDTWNVIPPTVNLRGTVRSFDKSVQDRIETDLGRIAQQVAGAFGAQVKLRYERRYPSTINSASETEQAAAVAAKVVGDSNVRRDARPVMGSEDFAFMLQARPGCFVFLGAGEDACPIHNPGYDFNDRILATGASYWATLAQEMLPPRS